jgi:predicted O-methyltransferase YrrM
LPAASRLKQLYLAYLSKPASDRLLYQTIRRERCRQIVEIGMGSGQRAVRMLDLAVCHHPVEELRYAAIDLFEARTGAAGLKLKEAHCLLKGRSAKVHLLPGDPLSALARAANTLGETDLLIVSHDQDSQSMAQAWFYVPRMLHAKSIVLVETLEQSTARWMRLSTAQIESMAKRPVRRAA